MNTFIDNLTAIDPSMKCYRKNGSDVKLEFIARNLNSLNEVLPKER